MTGRPRPSPDALSLPAQGSVHGGVPGDSRVFFKQRLERCRAVHRPRRSATEARDEEMDGGGRFGWPATSKPAWPGEPVLVTAANAYERFRIGGAGSWSDDPAQRKLLPGNQFPADHIWEFARQFVPRWTTTDEPTLKAYLQLVDKVCPCVLLVHSQAGKFGFQAAQHRPDKIRAVVAVEPAEVGDMDKVAALKGVPSLMVYGDYIEQDSRWPTIRAKGAAFAEAVRKAGGSVDEVDLPKVGIKGNSHMVMMDKNNLEVSALINDWLAKRGLYRP